MTWPLFSDRYTEIIPHFNDFLNALESDLPIGIRQNLIKYKNENLIERICLEEALSFKKPVPELSYFEVEGAKKFWGGRIEHHLGLYYMQALSSLLPVLALDPKVDEAVLDMCSAPGGKSAYLSELMECRGSLICNEPDLNRRRVLKANLERMGVRNSATFGFSGEKLPFVESSFDKILLDGPCSSEGTLRREHLGMKKRKLGNFINYNLDFRLNLQKIQYQLLQKAVSLLRPGGELVYSTCTYDPDENEAQVDRVLKEFPEMKVVPVDLPASLTPHLCEGLISYNDNQYDSSLRMSYRVYPHKLNSIGFYFAKLVREV